uniref:Uncharacterized protein n=2 Tax=Anguilla anguilla TaxID=7936 RepID=A0A0E9TQ00_ANGAN
MPSMLYVLSCSHVIRCFRRAAYLC